MTLSALNADIIVDQLNAGEITATDCVQHFLERIETHNSDLNAFISVSDKALEQAEAIDNRRKAGESLGCLAGLPIAIKDGICVAGQPTTAGSIVRMCVFLHAKVAAHCPDPRFLHECTRVESVDGSTRPPRDPASPPPPTPSPLPPTNHFAKGGFQSRTFFQGVNQETFSLAIFAQNFVGLESPSLRYSLVSVLFQ